MRILISLAVLAYAVACDTEYVPVPVPVPPDQTACVARCDGAIAAARHHRIPVVLDGFICTAAAACLEVTVEGALDHALAGHKSHETGHSKALDKLGKTPIFPDLNLRLGEGSGGALAVSVVKAALACHSGMATFEQAGVSGS